MKTSPSRPAFLRYLPNAITALRIVAIPVLLFFLAYERYSEAIVTFVAAGMTDWLDGQVARYVGTDGEEFGKRFDALADKLFVGSALVSLTILGAVPSWLTGIVLTRDVGLVTIASAMYLRGGDIIRVRPTQFGKWGTFFLLVLVVLGLIDLQSPEWLSPVLIPIIAGLAGVAVVVSGAQYLRRAILWSRGEVEA